MAASLPQPECRLRNLLPSPPLGPPRRPRMTRGEGGPPGRVTLEKVLGITSSSNSSFTCDPNTGLIAYSAGCVIVLLCPKKNKQSHIFNTSRKPLRALSFSPDGKYIVTGESGSRPAVRVWDVEEKTQVSELLGHKYGVSCVSFSPNMKYIVSVGYHHDMLVNVWDWKKETVVAKNKVSNKVLGVSFSEDSSYFVTVGNRHVKFWYLDASKELQVKGTVPLVGRSGLLGEHHNNTFCGVVCGKGTLAGHTFCISHSGLLCQFNKKRVLEKWIDLKISPSHCLCVSDELIFCGCMDGTVRIFNSTNLQYITNLPKPHYLGTDVAKGREPSFLFTKRTDSGYPDAIALAYDPCNQWISCVYNDHSLYIWDIKETKKVGKVWSALYHSSYVWNVEVYPDLDDDKACLPAGSFLTCSSDNTIRIWNLERSAIPEFQKNIYSHDLQKVLYMDNNIQCLKDPTCTTEKSENGHGGDAKSGVRVIRISPDGQHLASGDRGGNLRIHELKFMDELMKLVAHDGEVLCLEYSKPETGVMHLASASRDRLIHVFNVDKGYNLEQTLDDHSSSITAVKFASKDGQVQMISCGADKSIYFRASQQLPDGINFTRTHHVVEKTTLYDMDTDITQKYVAVACQDRNIRMYNVMSGKLKTFFKGSQGEDGSLLKVQMDPSGTFIATSCSDKNIAIFDLYSGECIASMFGHSEIVTGMKFTHDCKRLITVSADSCVFVWCLDPQMVKCMREQLDEVDSEEKPKQPRDKLSAQIRRETYIVPSDFISPSTEEEAESDSEDESDDESLQTPSKEGIDRDPTFLWTNGRLPLWAKKLEREGNDIPDEEPLMSRKKYEPCGRWAERANTDLIKNILVSNEDSYCCTPTLSKARMFCENEDDFSDEEMQLEKMEPKKLEHLLKIYNIDRRSSIMKDFENPGYSSSDMPTNQEFVSPETSECILYPMQTDESSLGTDSEYHVLLAGSKEVGDEKDNSGLPGSQTSNLDQRDQDVDSLDSDSNSEVGVSELDEKCGHASSLPQTPEDEKFLKEHFETLTDNLSEEKFDVSLTDLKPSQDNENDLFLNPRLSISARFLSRCQKNSRFASAFLPRTCQSQKMGEAPVQIKEESKLKIDSSRGANKTFEKKTVSITTKRNDPKGANHTEISAASATARRLPSIPKKHESEKIPRRSSLQPPSIPKGLPLGRASTGSSYMVATASSQAKIWRSASMGENINKKSTCMDEHSQQFGTIRPSSSMDLSSLRMDWHPKAGNAFKDEFKENLPPKQSEHNAPSCGNHEARANLTLKITNSSNDRILMPPPSMPELDLSHVTQRATSVKEPQMAYLSVVTPTEMKSLGRDEQNITTRLDCSENSVCSSRQQASTQEKFEFEETRCSKLSISPASYLRNIDQSGPDIKDILPEGSCGDGPIDANTSNAHFITVCQSPIKNKEMENVSSGTSKQVSISSCEMIVQELQNTFQKALQMYNEVTSCEDTECVKEQLQKKSIFTTAFHSIQDQVDSLGLDHNDQNSDELSSLVHEMKQSKDDAIARLETYYELVFKMMQNKMHSK